MCLEYLPNFPAAFNGSPDFPNFHPHPHNAANKQHKAQDATEPPTAQRRSVVAVQDVAAERLALRSLFPVALCFVERTGGPKHAGSKKQRRDRGHELSHTILSGCS